MKDNFSNISEAKIRLLVRQALLKEMVQGRISKFSWKTCDNVDIPDGFLGSKEAVKKIEKSAATAAQFYGVPGFVCDIFNATFGDNPEADRRDVIDRGTRTKSRKSLAFDLYSAEWEHLQTRGTKFIENMQNNIGSPDAASIELDKNAYEDMRGQIRNDTELQSDPLKVAKKINEILNISDKGTISQVKKLIKEDGVDSNTIINKLVSQAESLLKTITYSNLKGTAIVNAYGAGFPEYDRFLNLVDN